MADDGADSVASAPSKQDDAEASSSNDSSRATKRKAASNLEDDYMRNDPELYGLRRSVGCPLFPRVGAMLICSIDSLDLVSAGKLYVPLLPP